MKKPLRERLVIAVVEALKDGDPMLVIGVADNQVSLRWEATRGDSI